MARHLASLSILFLVAFHPASAQESPDCSCDCPQQGAIWKKILPIQLATAGKVKGTVRLGSESLAGATLLLQSPDTGFTESSDVDGHFEFFNIPPGTYRLTAELPGLVFRQKKGLLVLAGGTAEVALKMRIDESQMICIDCDATPLLPDGPHFVITREMMDKLPIR